MSLDFIEASLPQPIIRIGVTSYFAFDSSDWYPKTHRVILCTTLPPVQAGTRRGRWRRCALQYRKCAKHYWNAQRNSTRHWNYIIIKEMKRPDGQNVRSSRKRNLNCSSKHSEMNFQEVWKFWLILTACSSVQYIGKIWSWKMWWIVSMSHWHSREKTSE